VSTTQDLFTAERGTTPEMVLLKAAPPPAPVFSMLDLPRQREYRRMLVPPYGRRAVAALEARVRALARELLAPLVARGRRRRLPRAREPARDAGHRRADRPAALRRARARGSRRRPLRAPPGTGRNVDGERGCARRAAEAARRGRLEPRRPRGSRGRGPPRGPAPRAGRRPAARPGRRTRRALHAARHGRGGPAARRRELRLLPVAAPRPAPGGRAAARAGAARLRGGAALRPADEPPG